MDKKSLYELITDLCDKYVNKRKCINESINIQPIIKKLRVKAFEILLKKKAVTNGFNALDGIKDPICHLLAWQYSLKNDYNDPEKAEALNIFIKDLENSKLLQDPTVQNVILFLVYLRGSQSQRQNADEKNYIFDKVILRRKNVPDSSNLPYNLYPEHKFHFPDESSVSDPRSFTTFSVDSFTSEPNILLRLPQNNNKVSANDNVVSYTQHFEFLPLTSGSDTSFSSKKLIVLEDLQKSSTEIFEDSFSDEIWEEASKLPINEHKTWEALDQVDPPKELPFVCEAGAKTVYYFENIIDSAALVKNTNSVDVRIISSARFIKSVKYMLVGIASSEFSTSENGLFYLNERISIEGITASALSSYCEDLLCCGSSYRALNKLCSSYLPRNSEKYGYIFKELCESIKRYLAFYRVTALSMPDNSGLLVAHEHMRPLRNQICTFARLCKVGPFTNKSESGQIPQGINLLNDMYREITETVDKNVALVLYSAFYPCCQIYFSRFLQRWLFEGVLIDPYEEFMVKSETSYVHSRARIYWTRSFSLRENCLPDFLIDLKKEILQCGKTMNLLKLCNPDASLYTHIMSRSLPLISCCLTPDHITKLRQEIDHYYVEMASLCGPRISLYHKLRERYEENLVFLSLVEKKRALTLKKIELIKQQEAEKKAKMKRKIFEDIREQMQIAADLKKKAVQEELKQELLIAEQNAQIEELRSKLVEEETKVIIKYYNNLMEAVDKRRNSILLHTLKLIENEDEATKDENKNIPATDPETKTEKEEVSETEKHPVNTPLSEENPRSLNEDIKKPAPSEKPNLDVVNANVKSTDNLSNTVRLNNQINETFLSAKRNRDKIMNLEFGVRLKEPVTLTAPVKDLSHLTEAQRNKLRVLSSDFDLFSPPVLKQKTTKTEENENINKSGVKTELTDESNGNLTGGKTVVAVINFLSEAENNTKLNNNKNRDGSAEFGPKITASLASPGHENVMNIVHRQKNLTQPPDLPSVPEMGQYKSEESLEKRYYSSSDVTPMSVDSTPITEYPSELPTPSSAKLSLRTDIFPESPFPGESSLLTGSSNITDDGFRFPNPVSKFSENKHCEENLLRNISARTKDPKLLEGATTLGSSQISFSESNQHIANLPSESSASSLYFSNSEAKSLSQKFPESVSSIYAQISSGKSNEICEKLSGTSILATENSSRVLVGGTNQIFLSKNIARSKFSENTNPLSQNSLKVVFEQNNLNFNLPGKESDSEFLKAVKSFRNLSSGSSNIFGTYSGILNPAFQNLTQALVGRPNEIFNLSENLSGPKFFGDTQNLPHEDSSRNFYAGGKGYGRKNGQIFALPQNAQQMRLSKSEVEQIRSGNLKLLLHESVYIPLEAQVKLVNNEIIKYFVTDQNFFSHLHSLRCYYFLLDGEFGRHITEGLFNKLYEAKHPGDLLNCRTLQLIINKALFASSKVQENADKLSFIVQTIPSSFDLSNVDVLECLSLSYRINWPLNILLPYDTIEKYDLVFKYLLKLHHVSWILQKMFQELKLAKKECGVDENVLMRSPQYHRIQLFRHVMTHFMQTLQNYTVGEVLQTSWEELENNMKTVGTLDQLYSVHILYVKTIMFRCLLNKKCAPIMKVIREIFVVILKFYNYLRSRTWNLKENDFYYTHPNFKKLEDIYNKFEEFTSFVFRVGNKMARVGYQPHLIQMLDMLNLNGYYTNKQKM